jgi:hypothetical protein
MKMGMNLLSVVCRPQVHKKGNVLDHFLLLKNCAKYFLDPDSEPKPQ